MATRGTNIVGVRAYNDRLVLSIIRASEQIPKVEIARKTGLSATAVSAIVKNLEKNKLVKREKLERGRVGQPSMPFSINPKGAYSLGLKIGRRSAEMVLIDFLGNVKGIEVLEYPYPEKSSIIQFALESADKLYAAVPKGHQKRIAGLGVVMPNEIWKWNKLFRAPDANLIEWSDDTYLTVLREELDMPVFPMNDATAACGAELTLNNNLIGESYLYFFIGWFIGGGIVIDNKLYPGRLNNAGALGSMLINDQNNKSEQLINTSSISALEEQLIANGKSTKFKWDEAGWMLDDQIIDKWIKESANGIAQACACAISVIDFEKVIIDGVMPAAVRKKLIDEVSVQYRDLDTTGLSEIAFIHGQIGPQARSIGAAFLPLISSFSVDYGVLFKGIVDTE